MNEPMVLCWGEILWDLFPDGRQLGGAPANVAFHLAQLGSRVALVSRVGDDEPGRAAVAALASRGVDTSLVQIDPGRPTGSVDVSVDANGNASYRLNRGGAWEQIELTDEVARLLPTARALIFGTFCQRNNAAIAALRRAVALTPADALRVCDPNLRATGIDDDVLLWSLDAANVVKINHREAEAIEELFGTGDAVAWLRARGTRVVALTRGAEGSSLIGPSDEHDHPGFPANSGGDTVGAGDAYTAALTRLLLADVPIPQINELANRIGAFVASHRGATPRLPAALTEACSPTSPHK